MRSLDLFSGYGGITLALEEWCKPVAYVEIEEYAQRIIASRMADGSLPRAPILADVKNIEGQPGVCDIIIGGFPCQDISLAGNGGGLEGERSGLFFEIIRLVSECRPQFIFLENVPAITLRGLDRVLLEFTALGYDCRWTVVSANYVGAPHKRDRWFLLAHSNSKSFGTKSTKKQKCKDPSKPLSNGKGVQASNTTGKRSQGLLWKESQHPTASQLSRKKWFEVEPAVCRSTYGARDRMDRLKALGNGVVPEQVRLAFQYLIKGVRT